MTLKAIKDSPLPLLEEEMKHWKLKMSEHIAIIQWKRSQAKFIDNRYGREHTWKFDGGVEVPASASPHVVPAPYSNPAYVDPEEAFVASLSSCHMLWFLSIAAKKSLSLRIIPISYYADSFLRRSCHK